jgi:hypothetical protein
MMTLFTRLVAILEALPARRRSFPRFAVLSLLFLAGSSTSSFADFINYTLGVPNTAVQGYPGPYGNVNVNLTDPTHATITFTAQAPAGSGLTYRFGDGQSIDVNINATSWTVSNLQITDLASTGTLSVASPQAAGQVDGFGNFNQRFDDTTAGGTLNDFNAASFVLTNTGGNWGSAANVLTSNPDGFLAGAHLFVFTSSTPGASAQTTGFVANGTPTTGVPEPMTIVTLATAIPFGLLALRRRFRGDTPTV